MLGPPDGGTGETRRVTLGTKAKSAAAAFSNALILFLNIFCSDDHVTTHRSLLQFGHLFSVPLIRHSATILRLCLQSLLCSGVNNIFLNLALCVVLLGRAFLNLREGK
jgi:hypothetical protein